MAHDATIDLFWGEGETRFRLGIGELLALEAKLDVGAQELLDRFIQRRWRLRDAREVLRLGLLGAGHGMEKTNKLISTFFDKPDVALAVAPLEHGPFAMAVLIAGLSGPEEDDTGKTTAEVTASGAGASSPPPSTAPAPSSGGRPARSTRARSSSSPRPSKAGTKRRAAKAAPPSR